MPPAASISPRNITAVILAGGASSRMGRDKALLNWRGLPFIAYAIECLRMQAGNIAISTHSASDFVQFGLPLLSDAMLSDAMNSDAQAAVPATERCGPLAGIMAALNYSKTEFTLIVPCDNPMLSPLLVSRLITALDNTQIDLAYAYCNGDHHYLYALMRSDLRDNLAAFLRTHNYAVRYWYSTLRSTRVDFSDQPEYFRNINNPDDLSQLPS